MAAHGNGERTRRVVVERFGGPGPGGEPSTGARAGAGGDQKLRIPHQDWFQEDFDVLLRLLREQRIHPVVAERLPFSEARHAHELLESAAAKGKVVLVP